MKRIFALVTIIAIVAVGLSGCFRYEAEEAKIEIFTDSTGVQWRVLAENEEGNRLIITEYVYGLTQYNSENVYTRLGQSDVLRLALNAWFTNILAPELKEIALPAENVNNDVRSMPGEGSLDFFGTVVLENETAGWTVAGLGTASPENSLFVLSISEVNKYQSLGTLNKQGMRYLIGYGIYVPVAWWLRSPGSCIDGSVVVMGAGDTEGPIISSASATESYGFRPALWVSR